ncbi:MscL family protein, partial [Bacillus sp. S34]|nr:MscL family protein [Bacillus sp. S34]
MTVLEWGEALGTIGEEIVCRIGSRVPREYQGHSVEGHAVRAVYLAAGAVDVAIDLAVAVVIGAAFTAIVTVIVSAIINPAIGAVFNASSLDDALKVDIPTVAGGKPATLMFGAVIGAALNFVIVAAVVYFALVLPVTPLKKVAFERVKND